MTLDEFKKTLQNPQPLEKFSLPLQALWYEAKGSWEKAHEIAQSIEDETGSLIHAYLHRKEGDYPMHVVGNFVPHLLRMAARR